VIFKTTNIPFYVKFRTINFFHIFHIFCVILNMVWFIWGIVNLTNQECVGTMYYTMTIVFVVLSGIRILAGLCNMNSQK
jgi:hypothetical protein